MQYGEESSPMKETKGSELGQIVGFLKLKVRGPNRPAEHCLVAQYNFRYHGKHA